MFLAACKDSALEALVDVQFNPLSLHFSASVLLHHPGYFSHVPLTNGVVRVQNSSSKWRRAGDLRAVNSSPFPQQRFIRWLKETRAQGSSFYRIIQAHEGYNSNLCPCLDVLFSFLTDVMCF